MVAEFGGLSIESCCNPVHVDLLPSVHSGCIGDIIEKVVFDLG